MTEQWLIIWNEKQYNYKKLLEDINNGHRKVEEWADKVGSEIIEIDDESEYNFLNINTKEDLQKAKNKIK